ncbi:hypothetical protein RVB5_14830 [Pseudomonas aeruginosa]
MDQAPGWGADHNVFAAAKEGRAGPRPPSPALYYLPCAVGQRYSSQCSMRWRNKPLCSAMCSHWST